MRKLGVKIVRLWSAQWSAMIQYRTDLLLWTVADAMAPLIAFVVWYNVAASAHSPYNQQQMVTYYILVILTTIITQAWGGYFLAQEILNGDLVKYLVRPVSVFWNYFINNVVEKILKLFIPIIIIAIILIFKPSLFIPEVYQVSHLLLFVVSVILATFLNFMLDMVLGVLAFWLEDANELRRFKYLVEEFASGTLIPLVMLSPIMVNIISWLPFRYVISAPIELLMGQTSGVQAWQLLAIQLGWSLGLLVLLMYLWRKGLRHYAVPGQ